MSYDPSDHAVGARRAAGAWLASLMVMTTLFGPSMIEAGVVRAAHIVGLGAAAAVERLPGPWRDLRHRRGSVRAPHDRPDAVEICLDLAAT